MPIIQIYTSTHGLNDAQRCSHQIEWRPEVLNDYITQRELAWSTSFFKIKFAIQNQHTIQIQYLKEELADIRSADKKIFFEGGVKIELFVPNLVFFSPFGTVSVNKTINRGFPQSCSSKAKIGTADWSTPPYFGHVIASAVARSWKIMISRETIKKVRSWSLDGPPIR